MYRVSGRFGFKRDMHRDFLDTGEILGKGARGVVSVVTERASGDKFACKTMLKNGTPAWKEVAALQALTAHPHVAQLHGVYEDDAYVQILMELCAGGTLDGKTPEHDVREHVRTALLVLRSMHDMGMVHRDVKPGNFVRTAVDGAEVKAIDFGLADSCEAAAAGTPAGTLWYMAPETFSGRTCQKSDVWSAGVMAAELITGRVPFDDHANRRAPAVRAVVKSIMFDRLDRLDGLDGGDAFRDLVRSMLSRDVRDRPTAAQALEHACFFVKR
jgi:calcium-dependent protein kinase